MRCKEQEAASHDHHDRVVQLIQWEPDVKIYQHFRSSIVHSLACGIRNNRFSCGNLLTKDYKLASEVL